MCSLCAVVADYAGMSMASMQRAQSVVVYDGTIACVVACWLEGVCRASVGGERSSLWVAGALGCLGAGVLNRLQKGGSQTRNRPELQDDVAGANNSARSHVCCPSVYAHEGMCRSVACGARV